MNDSTLYHARSRARIFAMQAAYQQRMREQDVDEVRKQFIEDSYYDKVDAEYFNILLQAATSDSLDKKLEECMEYSIKEVDIIEGIILRSAAYEIACIAEIDRAVAINEAIHIAKRFCSAGSYRFINGVLDCFAKKYASTAF